MAKYLYDAIVSGYGPMAKYVYDAMVSGYGPMAKYLCDAMVSGYGPMATYLCELRGVFMDQWLRICVGYGVCLWTNG